jgi:O-acetyl-ADP-ribose deacetylase (regulator of RNase III)
MDRVDIEGTSVRVVVGDITQLAVGAIVNAANEQLDHGGGVAASIARAGAPDVDRESRAWVRDHGPVRPGTAAVTSAGPMPAHVVVHVVGPRYRLGAPNEALLRQAVGAALDAAAASEARSVAFPAISAGIFGYPRREATRVIASAVAAWIAEHTGSMDEILLVGNDPATADDFRTALDSL